MKADKQPVVSSGASSVEDELYAGIRKLIVSARRTVSRSVNWVQVHTNFEIGRHIVEYEQKGKLRAGYGQEIIKNLAERLTIEFGRGFSKSNLEYMRRFFLAYKKRIQNPQPQIGQSLAGTDDQANIAQFKIGQLAEISSILHSFRLGWTHYIFLLGIKSSDERDFYEIEAAAQDWNMKELKRQFNSGLYERLALSRDKEGIRRLAQEGQIVDRPEDLLKDPLVLEFLGLDEQARYSESDLETAIINQIEKFLLELGKGFLFEARQKRFSFDEEHFFVDLVFYNRLLQCYVLVDLKIGKLTHQDLGQMQMYVNYFDRFIKTEQEKPTIGIILCQQKNESLVEITLPKDANIHANEYTLYLPSKEELKQKLKEWAGEAGE
ncbi:MAG: PDDEXK nuclease domain-containing protein [Rectinemataceae bacterium]